MTTAGSVDEALVAARQEFPELAVVDLRMPGRSGLDLVRELRALNSVPKPADVDELLIALARGLGEPNPQVAEDVQAPSLARAEWEHIQRVLTDCEGNISEAARRLGLHRRSLQRKLQKYPPAQ